MTGSGLRAEGHGGDTLSTDRRTRDRVRLFFWAVLTIVCLSAVLVSHQQQQQGLRLKAEGAQERAIRYTENVLDGRLDTHRVAMNARAVSCDDEAKVFL